MGTGTERNQGAKECFAAHTFYFAFLGALTIQAVFHSPDRQNSLYGQINACGTVGQKAPAHGKKAGYPLPKTNHIHDIYFLTTLYSGASIF